MTLPQFQDWERRIQALEAITQRLPPTFLAQINAINAPGQAGVDQLYVTFDVQAVDENKVAIPGQTLVGVQAAIGLYQLIPDLLAYQADGTTRRLTSEAFTGVSVAAAGSTDSGGGGTAAHSHGLTSRSIAHTHDVFPATEFADLAAWRDIFFAGDGAAADYLAIVNSTQAGGEAYHYIAGFVAAAQVLTSTPSAIMPAPVITIPPLPTGPGLPTSALNLRLDIGGVFATPAPPAGVVRYDTQRTALIFSATDYRRIAAGLGGQEGIRRGGISVYAGVGIGVLTVGDYNIISNGGNIVYQSSVGQVRDESGQRRYAFDVAALPDTVREGIYQWLFIGGEAG